MMMSSNHIEASFVFRHIEAQQQAMHMFLWSGFNGGWLLTK